MICVYRKRGLRIAHLWFLNNYKELAKIEADIIFIHGSHLKKHPALDAVVSSQNTLISSLCESELSSRFSRDTRRHIRRAEEDPILVSHYDSRELTRNPELVKEFGNAYETMFEQKGRRVRFNFDLVKAYIAMDMLVVSVASYADQNIVFHSYIVSEKTVRALHSVSIFREGSVDPRIIGRANKYLHYQDMVYFQEQGKTSYDWGGISNFDNPNGIDKFKLEFGGQKQTYSNIILGHSILGKSAILAKKVLARSTQAVQYKRSSV